MRAGVLGAELDLGVAAQLPGGRGGPSCTASLRAPPRGHAQLVLEVDVGGGDEEVQVRLLGRRSASTSALRVAVAAARQAGDRDALASPRRSAGRPRSRRARRPGSRPRSRRRPGARAGGRPRASRRRSGRAGRLLAVAQRRVEDADDRWQPAPSYAAFGYWRALIARAPAPRAPRRSADACACPASTSTGFEERHLRAQLARRPSRSGGRGRPRASG